MRLPVVFGGVALLAALAGTALWLGERSTAPAFPGPAKVAPTALYAAAFMDETGARQALDRFQGKVMVINFWATWCAPCREEMPLFSRLQERWGERGVQFVGLTSDDAAKSHRFGREMAIAYPLWTGGAEVDDLSRRLGNSLGVLPHTAIVDRTGRVLETKVGPYSERDLEARLKAAAAKSL